MKFVDVVELKLNAGKGGDGAVAFRRELYVPKGGPAGGDGGKGGDIIFIASNDIGTLLDLKFQKIIKADDGENGQNKNKHGHKAKNKYIKIPVGTLIINKKTNKILFDFIKNGQEHVIAKGGIGGRGNSRFASSRNKAPTIFERGKLGEEIEIKCELKLLADVGFIGLPNAGKSTLLSVLTKAKPQIANYEFTTLNPQLGVSVDKNKRSFVIADLPGLIKGASYGKGLGHIFLKHIERCRVIVHVIDSYIDDYNKEKNNLIFDRYETINKELKDYNLKILEKKQIIVLNKIDLVESDFNKQKLKDFKQKLKDEFIMEVSGLTKINLEQLKIEIANLLDEIESHLLWKTEKQIQDEQKEYKLYKFENPNYNIEIKIEKLGTNKWNVFGSSVFNIYHRFPPKTRDNLLIFNNELQKIGVFDELRKKKVKQGDIIKIFELEMEWKD